MSTRSARCRGLSVLWGLVLAATIHAEAGGPTLRLEWLSDLGAESISAGESSQGGGRPTLAVTPGALYSFALEANGTPLKLNKLPADYSIPYGVASSGDSTVVVASDGWVSFRSDLDTEEWRKELGDRVMSVGWDGGEIVLVATRSGRLLALSSSDGTEQWSIDIGGRAEGAPVRDGDDVLVATKSNHLFRIDAATGKLRWSAELPGPAHHPPVLAGDAPRLVVVGAWNGHVTAFDIASGSPEWSVELVDRLAGAPAAGESFVAVASANGAVGAFDFSGELLWADSDAARGAADLVIHDDVIVVSDVLNVLDAETGKVLENYPDGAVADLEQRFLDAMIEGEKVFSETEKAQALERESFPISGRLFGEARLRNEALVFSTEDGWVYWFDASSLRPLSRYHIGQRASHPPVLTSHGVVAASTDEIFGLHMESGRTLWRRGLGDVQGLASSDDALGVIADDRLSVFDAANGTRRWRASGVYSAVTAPASVEDSLWLAVSAEDRLELFDRVGNRVGDPLSIGGVIVATVATGARQWAAATEEGRLVGLFQPARYGFSDGDDVPELAVSWEVQLDEGVRAMHFAGETLLVESEDGFLSARTSADGAELWRLPLDEGARYELDAETGQMVVFGESVLRVYEPGAGEASFERELESAAVGVELQNNTLMWLDRAGRAHWTELINGETEITHLGVPLERAFAVTDGFVVTTTAGEVGLAVIDSDESVQEDER